MRYASYDANGQITRVYTGPKASIDKVIESGRVGLVVDGDVDLSTKYVDNGVLMDKGDAPSEHYTFDYISKSWVFDLDSNKAIKWSEIKSAREADEFGGFDWNGSSFQSDEISQQRIQGAVQLAMMDSNFTIDWTLADNSVVTLTASEMIQVGQTLAAHVNACHVKGRQKRALIDAATTEQDLLAITW